jgi:hypothetical protein
MMKKTFMRYALRGGITMLVLYSAIVLIINCGANNVVGMVITYTAMVVSLCFVYFGIRYYRDMQNNGVLNFWPGIKLGLLISLVPSVIFGLCDVVYVTIINPHFAENYEAAELQQLKITIPPAQFATEAVKLKERMAFFKTPLGDFAIMFLNVMAIGLIITVISTFMLKRNVAKKAALEFA